MKKDAISIENINKDYLQKLQDNFSSSAQVSSVILNEDGKAVTEPTLIKTISAINKNYEKIKDECFDIVKNTKESIILVCPDSGEEIGCIPIVHDERFIGAWAISSSSIGNALSFLSVLISEIINLLMGHQEDLTLNNELEIKTESLIETKKALLAMKAFTNSANVFIYVTDYYTGEIIMCNDAFASSLDSTQDELEGKICWQLIGYKERCPFCPYEKLIDENKNPLPVYIWDNYLEIFKRWLSLSNKALYWVDGRLVHMCTYMDITKRREMEDNLNTIAFYDRRFNLPNNASLERDLDSLQEDASLILIDVQGLSKINEVYGRDCGDTLLDSIRKYILSLCIENSVLYCLDIANFGLLIPSSYSEAFVKALAHRIKNRCQEVWKIETKAIHDIYVSANICIIPLLHKSFANYSSFINAAEQTCELARKTGEITFFNIKSHKDAHFKLMLELSLKNAVRNDMKGFSISYQPIVDLSIAMWKGCEAFCSWSNEKFGEVDSKKIISIAETTGLIHIISNWIIEQSIIQVKKLGLDRKNDFLLHVNVSPIYLSKENLAENLKEILKKYYYPANKLSLEITETNELSFSSHVMETLKKLTEAGVVISIKDFGTGYSSLNSLHETPASILKTERSFINGVERTESLQHLLRVIVDLAHSSDLQIIADGVETSEQVKYLLREGIYLYQGEYFSKPLGVRELTRNLNNFFIPLPELVSMGYVRIDLSKITDNENGYILSNKHYRLLNKCSFTLFHSKNIKEDIENVLKQVGEVLNVNRSYVILQNTNGNYEINYKWSLKEDIVWDETFRNVPFSSIRHDIDSYLKNSGILISSDIRKFPKNLRNYFQFEGIQSLVCFPLWKGNDLFGIVGLSDHKRMRNWSAEEVQILYNLTNMISTTLSKMWLSEEIEIQNKKLERILDNMNTSIYVSDLETNEILFANSKLKSICRDDLKGKICWSALHDRMEPCEHCVVEKLKDETGAYTMSKETYQYEFHDKEFNKYFMVSDSIIPWTGGKLAHLKYAEDITNLKDYQSKLEIYASMDLFTNTLNRFSFLANAKLLLEKANRENIFITIAFIDIDNLKYENDTKGHKAGDLLIKNVVEALKVNITENIDVMGRYGGDEFVIAFYDCSIDEAKRKIEKSLKKLHEISASQNRSEPMEFSFGLAENTELCFTNSDSYIDNLIRLADTRMFDYKKLNKTKK